MTVQQALCSHVDLTDMVMKSYLNDLNDADLMTRPGPGCNHLAWQLGHLITSEQGLLEQLLPGSGIKLPEGFAEKHDKKQIDNNDPKQFYTKQEYVDLYKKSRQNVKDTIAKLSTEEFDKPAPANWQKMFKTAGDMFNLIASHAMMHAGQFAVVRRNLGKPVVI